MDTLIVKGLGRALDGEYEFDFGDMLGVGTPGSLTNREGHRIKVMSGVRMGELEDALIAGDSDVMIAIAAIILTRNGKRFDEDLLWDSPMGSGVSFELANRQPEEDEDSPPVEPAETPDETQSTSGGKSSVLTLANQENGQSPTGPLDFPRSAISVQQTSAT